MTPASVLLSLAEAGVVVWLDGDRVRFRAAAGALTDELRADVARCRPGLVALLAAGAVLPVGLGTWPEDARADLAERAGVMEFEGGLVREVAERAAEHAVRVAHVRSCVARKALVVVPAVAVAARLGGGPHR